MSLLRDREIARRRLEIAVKNLLDCQNLSVSTKAPNYLSLCKRRVKFAKKRFYAIEKKLSKVHNHAMSPQLEFIAKLMVIFKPELKNDIESVVTFT